MDKQTVVITGGSHGIGLALVKVFLNAGYRVISTSRSGNAGDFRHPDLIFFAMQLAYKESIDNAANLIAMAANGIDLLINNAGIADDLGVTVPQFESFTTTININLTGQVLFTEAILSSMKNGAAILNISSAMGLLANVMTDSPAYRISKGALNIYTKMLAQRLAQQNISVAAIHPGWVKTRLGGDAAPIDADQSAAAIFEQYQQGIDTATFIDAITGVRTDL